MSDPYSPFSSDPANPYASPQVQMMVAPGVRWLQDPSPSLRQTGLGLSLVYYGIVTMLLCILLMLLVAVVAMAASSPLFLLLMLPAGLGILVANILTLVGPIVCLAVPEESGAKGLILGSVIFQLINLVASVLGAIAPRLLPQPLPVVLNLCGIVGYVLFVLFMKKLSEYVGRLDLAARAKNVLIGFGVLVGLGVVLLVGLLGTGFFAAAAGPAGMGRGAPPVAWAPMGLLMLLGALVLGVGSLVVFVMQVNLIDGLRKALRRDY